jgi:DNA-binding MarR family transcriptional regulator
VDALRRILRALRVSAGTTQATLGISAAQLFVLQALAGGEACSISQLAERTLTDRSSVAAVVDRLAAQSLVQRATARDDRRRAEVRITSGGERLLAGAAPSPTSLVLAALRHLPAEDVRALADSLTELAHAMGLDATPATMLFEDGAGGGGPVSS